MKNKILLLIFVIFLSQIVLSIEVCDDTPSHQNTCKMVTPVINCTLYTYEVYNQAGGLTDNGNLTIFDTNIYYWNFTQNAGTYLLKLCDDTTREIYVSQEDKNLGWMSIIILLVGMTALLGYGANSIKEKALKPTKIVLFVLFIVNVLMLGVLSYIVSMNAFDPTSFNTLGLAYASINVFVIFGFMINYIYKTLYKSFISGKNDFRNAFNNALEKKK